ncbi:sec-independent protein translocase protein TatB [Roseiarcus fermentans]|uniref:Sec-independent protein translocase protein TatB n=1 Tax=Roseiarcus fermentans TaxID=1473586 RepID=A0A366FQ74_9HYPH|nr:Sec-independent protein translocase protein TatB [Roseiarcus fermentans]RBP16802.1 sec-independent protein translocase protein TatB [Roseiarcus fermentans]
MFDFDIGKMLVVAIVALAVIPPKDLPRVMRTVGQAMGRMRRMASEFQGQFMDAMREAEFDSVRKELAELNQKATASIAELNKATAVGAFDPAVMIRDEVTKAAEPLAHLPAPAPEGAEIGASEVALTPAPEAKPGEAASQGGEQPVKSSAAE